MFIAGEAENWTRPQPEGKEAQGNEGSRKAHGDRGAGTWPQESVLSLRLVSAFGAVT